ncbi:MAG: HAD-IA family hydrolase [Planctomycetota bacterium]
MTGHGKKIRAVFFDAGGTLMAPNPSVGAIYAAVAERFGCRAAPAEFERHLFRLFGEYGVTDRAKGRGYATSDEIEREMWRYFSRRLYDEMEAFRRAGVDFEAWYAVLYDTFAGESAWALFPDALPVLDALRGKGIRTGIISNWDSRLPGICRGLEIEPRVEFVLASGPFGVRKPGGAIFGEALRRADVTPDEALHVGDSFAEDVMGAEASGIRGVLLDRFGHDRQGCPTVRGLMEVMRFVDGTCSSTPLRYNPPS